jgi:hypothetical protein
MSSILLLKCLLVLWRGTPNFGRNKGNPFIVEKLSLQPRGGESLQARGKCLKKILSSCRNSVHFLQGHFLLSKTERISLFQIESLFLRENLSPFREILSSSPHFLSVSL